MAKEKACRGCKKVVAEGKECPICKGTAFTTFWQGYVVILDPEKSEIAKLKGITTPGKYALRLSR